MEQLQQMSVSEIKQILSENSVDYSDCLEKQDLINRLIEHMGVIAP
eukprot:SAG31_NODE_4711_length_3016_cov_5.967089_1_plen_46_part_00